MNRSALKDARWSILAVFLVLASIAAIILVPGQFRSEAVANKTAGGLSVQTVSHDEALPNYDIRMDKTAFEKIAAFRGSLNKDAAAIADLRDGFTKGEEQLRSRVPSLKIEYNTDIRIPEVIAPDVKQGRSFLTGASGEKRSKVLINFLRQNRDLIGATDEQISGLKAVSDYTNPAGNLSFVELNQEINGIPVFRGEVKAGFARDGEIIRVVNNLAPGLDYERLSTDFGDPADAVKAAASYIDHDLKPDEISRNNAISSDKKAVFGQGDFAATAEKTYFPTEPGVAVAAWRVLIWQAVNAFYVIVDAETGTMLWRKNITEDQTQAATYRVYVNPNAMINVADNPFPMTPGPVTLSGIQGSAIPRTSITRIGNEPPYTFNNNGWITDGGNSTDGNNVQAGLDRELPNANFPANPADIDPNGTASGSPSRVFDFPINPGVPTNPAL
ncbi:MAG: hypothetical protein H7070_06930, partial [Saprospiraceae bacterium]|nr:hypothetical protein [Pyrinomonadaceae bacterium]